MKKQGINVIFNGYLYHFNDPAGIEMPLEQMADSVTETDRGNAVMFDNELREGEWG